jgi:NAD(P)-dependent dehydrogenase (short-subunit alcohol dehydrogenase family)
VGILGPTGRDS